jgi:hypothetical protein
LVKTAELAEKSIKQFLPMLQTKPKSNLAEAVHLAIYTIGSSRYVYHLYQLLRKLGLADWKAMLTTEPSRLGENYATGDLAMVEGQVQLSNVHAGHLRSIHPRPLGGAALPGQCQILGAVQSSLRLYSGVS